MVIIVLIGECGPLITDKMVSYDRIVAILQSSHFHSPSGIAMLPKYQPNPLSRNILLLDDEMLIFHKLQLWIDLV